MIRMDVTVVRDETRWEGLRDELRDLAFMLDSEGNHSGADVASLIAARIGELLADDPAGRGAVIGSGAG